MHPNSVDRLSDSRLRELASIHDKYEGPKPIAATDVDAMIDEIFESRSRLRRGPVLDTDLLDIKTRLYGGDAEDLSPWVAELLFTDLPRLLAEVERVRGLFPDAEGDAGVLDQVFSDARAHHDARCFGMDAIDADTLMELADGLARRLRQVRGESE